MKRLDSLLTWWSTTALGTLAITSNWVWRQVRLQPLVCLAPPVPPAVEISWSHRISLVGSFNGLPCRNQYPWSRSARRIAQFNVVSSTCSTGSITVDLSTNHPDDIVSTRDAISIEAQFSSAVHSPTLIYTSVLSTTLLPMEEIVGTQGTQWLSLTSGPRTHFLKRLLPESTENSRQ